MGMIFLPETAILNLSRQAQSHWRVQILMKIILKVWNKDIYPGFVAHITTFLNALWRKFRRFLEKQMDFTHTATISWLHHSAEKTLYETRCHAFSLIFISLHYFVDNVFALADDRIFFVVIEHWSFPPHPFYFFFSLDFGEKIGGKGKQLNRECIFSLGFEVRWSAERPHPSSAVTTDAEVATAWEVGLRWEKQEFTTDRKRRRSVVQIDIFLTSSNGMDCRRYVVWVFSFS